MHPNEVVRAAAAEMCMRDKARAGWSGNNAMLLYAMVSYGATQKPHCYQFVVRGTYADVFALLSSRERELRAVWKDRQPVPEDLRADMFFYENFRGRSGPRIKTQKTIADNFKYLLSMTAGEVPFTAEGEEYAVSADLRSNRDELSIFLSVRSPGSEGSGAPPIVNLPKAPNRLRAQTRRDIELHFEVFAGALARAEAEDALVLDLKRLVHQGINDPDLFPYARPQAKPVDSPRKVIPFLPHRVLHQKTLDYWSQRIIDEVVLPEIAKLSPEGQRSFFPQPLIDELAANHAMQIALMEDVWARVLLRRNRKRMDPEMLELIERRAKKSYRLFLPIGVVASLAPGSYTRQQLHDRFQPIAAMIMGETAERIKAYLYAVQSLAFGGHKTILRSGRRSRLLKRMYGWKDWEGRGGPADMTEPERGPSTDTDNRKKT